MHRTRTDAPRSHGRTYTEGGSTRATTAAQVWAAVEEHCGMHAASEGEERWAEQVMSNDWISAFEEQTSLNTDGDCGSLDDDPLTHDSFQQLLTSVE